MSERIDCPNCGFEIEITQVLSDQVAANIRGELQAKFSAKERQLAAEREKFESRRKQLDQREQELEQRAKQAVESERDQLAEKLRGEARQAVAVELQDRDAELRETKQRLREAQSEELELRKRQRELEQREEELKLQVARQIDQERHKIQQEARKKVQQENELKLTEKDHIIATMTKQLQELQRQAEQGSQQIQGEVQEIALERLLSDAFPHDVIEPVAKGARGGDAIHHVFDDNGRECGVILWESKRTKNWSDKWVGKLIDDQQQAKAACSCIVSATMPENVDHFGEVNGVWVTSWACARSAAFALRRVLIEAAQSRRAADGQSGKMELVYNYLSGPEFRNRVKGLVEPIADMQRELDAEKKAYNRVWNKRQKQLDRAFSSTFGLYGDLQGIIGNGLQEIEGRDLLALEHEEM